MITMDNGIEIKRFDDFNFDCETNHDNPSTPNTSAKTLSIPGKPGLIYFGEDIGEKPFNFNLTMHERSYQKVQDSLNKLNAFLFNEYGQPRLIKITFDYEEDKFYMVVVDGTLIPIREIFEKTMAIKFMAYYPNKFAYPNQYDESIFYGQVQENDYFDNPSSFKWLYSKHYSAIYNYSSLIAEFSIEVRGTVTNPSIKNLITNEILTLPSITNGTLKVSSRDYTIEKNGEETLLGSNGNFFKIQPGEVGFLFSGDSPNAEVIYTWLHEFK